MRTLVKVTFLVIALVTGVVLTPLGMTANFAPTTYNPDVGELLLFKVFRPAVERGSATYDWDFDGDGTYEVSTGDEVVRHTFDKPGYRSVTLRVTTASGRHVTRVKGILVGASPLYAIRTTSTDDRGAISVLITLVAREWIRAPGFVEEIPLGFQAKPVGKGEAIGVNVNALTRYLEVLFAKIPAGEEQSFGYWLYPSVATGCPVLTGEVSGYGPNGRIEAPICGDLSQH